MSPDIAIRFERVSKSFGGRKVLDAVSFDVERHKGFCILGRSGTGKSVTLRQMIGLMRPDSGSIFINGENLGSLDSQGVNRIRKEMGFLFQYSALFDSISVGDNVAFPLRRHTTLKEKEITTRVDELLAQVGLEEHRRKMPSEISGGMQKRVGLARAMALNPSMLLVDEPTASLDPENAQVAMNLLQQACREKRAALLCVSHDPAMASRFERRASLDELAAAGTTAGKAVG